MGIIDEITAERGYQVAKWGHDVDDRENSPWMWAAYIAQYATRWMSGKFIPLTRTTTDDFRTCMIKVATLAIAAIESIDRQREEHGKTFYEESSDDNVN